MLSKNGKIIIAIMAVLSLVVIAIAITMAINNVKIKSANKEEIAKLIAEQEQTTSDLTTNHNQELQTLTANHNQELQTLRQRHEDEQTSLNEQVAELQQLQTQQQAELQQLQTQQQAELQQLRTQHLSELNQAQEALRISNTELQDLRATVQANRDILNNSFGALNLYPVNGMTTYRRMNDGTWHEHPNMMGVDVTYEGDASNIDDCKAVCQGTDLCSGITWIPNTYLTPLNESKDLCGIVTGIQTRPSSVYRNIEPASDWETYIFGDPKIYEDLITIIPEYKSTDMMTFPNFTNEQKNNILNNSFRNCLNDILTYNGYGISYKRATATTPSECHILGDTYLGNAPISAGNGNTTMSSGNTTMSSGNTTMSSGNTTMSSGNTTMKSSNTTMSSGNTGTIESYGNVHVYPMNGWVTKQKLSSGWQHYPGIAVDSYSFNNEPDLSACRRSCANDPACTGVSWNPSVVLSLDEANNIPMCSKTDGIKMYPDEVYTTNLVETPNWETYLMNIDKRINNIFPGYRYKNIIGGEYNVGGGVTSDSEECFNRCKNRDDCIGISFKPALNGAPSECNYLKL